MQQHDVKIETQLDHILDVGDKPQCHPELIEFYKKWGFTDEVGC